MPQEAEGALRVVRLKQPERPGRARLAHQPYNRRPGVKPPADPANPYTWEEAETVAECGFTTDSTGVAKKSVTLKTGIYRALVETQDRFGKKITAMQQFLVVDPDAKRFAVKVPSHVAAPSWKLEPGDTFEGLWGSGYDKCQVFTEIEHRGKVIQSYWTDPKQTQIRIRQEITEGMRGGFIVRFTMVRENRGYIGSRKVFVPWSNKNLAVKWERFVSELEPAAKERWTAVLTGPDAKKAAAEMVCTLYDESLDQYLKHNWPQHFSDFFEDRSHLSSRLQNSLKILHVIHSGWRGDYRPATIQYRRFPHDISTNFWRYQYLGNSDKARRKRGQSAEFLRSDGDREASKAVDALAANAPDARALRQQATGTGVTPGGANLDKVTARKDLAETAFFFPHLIAGEDGSVRMEFTMPEALTRWRFMGFAHDKGMRGGYLQDSVVTAKELMIEPNPPRFLREGDELEFTVKVTNQSAAAQKGTVRLTFADARTLASADATLGNTVTDLGFEVPSKRSKTFSWRVSIPDGTGFLTYKAVGSTGRHRSVVGRGERRVEWAVEERL